MSSLQAEDEELAGATVEGQWQRNLNVTRRQKCSHEDADT